MLGETKDNPQTSGCLTSGLRFKLRWGENGVWCDCCLRPYEEYLKLNRAMSTKHTNSEINPTRCNSIQRHSTA